MEVGIRAIGTANPEFKRCQHETAELISTSFKLKSSVRRVLKSIYKSTGIEYRYSVLSDYCKLAGQLDFFPNNPDAPFPSTSARMKVYQANALKLSLAAIENCLDSLNDFNKKEITHLITVSCTGMYAPGIDIEIVQTLDLNPATKRTMINFMGCYGAFNGIKVAEALCRADSQAKVLVVCVELCTIHFQNNFEMDNIISNAIFADGAAAVLIQANPQQKKYFSLESFYCDLLPQTKQEMVWQIGDSGFDIVLSSYVPEVIKTGIANFTQKLFNRSGITFANVDFYAIHPGGLKILQACEEALNISEAHNKYSYQVLRNYGNMSSATVLFVLKAIWDDINQRDHHKNIFSCAFGPGLTLESMILRMHCV